MIHTTGETFWESTTSSHPQPTQIANFDFEAVDAALGNPTPPDPDTLSPEEGAKLSSALAELLSWVWKDGLHGHQTATRKVAAITAAISPDIFHSASYETIGAALGTGKANMSRLALEFQDRWKIHCRRSRRAEARRKFAKAQRGNRNAAKRKL